MTSQGNLENGPQEPLASEERTPEPKWPLRAIQSIREFMADNAGLLLVVIGQVFFVVMDVAVKLLSAMDPPVSPLQLILARMVITYLFTLAYMLGVRMNDPILGPKGVRLLLVARGVTGFVALFGVYFSLQYLSLSDAIVLTFLSPLCTAIAGAVLLRETFRVSQAVTGVVSFAGVVLIARPPFLFGGAEAAGVSQAESIVKGGMTERVVAVGVALVGVLGITGAYITIRAIGTRAHTVHVLAYYAQQCILVSAFGMIVTKTPFVVPSRLDWFGLLFLIGTMGFVAQVLITMGIKREAAGRASMAVYTQIVFATIFQLAIFHTIPSWLSILGTCLILLSAAYVAVTKERTKFEDAKHGPVNLNVDDYDHLEAALHAPPTKTSNTS